MKGLKTLIKLSKRTLDELRRKMGALENQKSQLLLLSKTLQEELLREIEIASKTPDISQFFANFSGRIKKRQADITKEVLTLDKQIEAVRLEITAAFAEQKKYEVALENAMLRKAQEAARLETIAMDEIASQQHYRKMQDH